MLRRQPPVHSPVTLAALLAGAAGLAAGDTEERVRLALRDACHAVAALLTDSGTTALSLSVGAALSARPGPVALPAFGCYDLATAADAAGADVVLYDIDPATLGPDEGSFAAALAREPAAVVLVHHYGMPVRVPELTHLATAAGAAVIEDAAQGVGGRLCGRPLGSFGPLSVLSFGRGKGLTGGSGGALLATSDEAARTLLALEARLGAASSAAKPLAALAAQWLLSRPSLYALPASLPFLGLGETHYRPVRPARRMSKAACRVLERVLPLREAEAETRRRNAVRLLGHVRGRLKPVSPIAGAEPGYLRLPVLSPPAERSALLERAAHLGVMASYPSALCDLPGFSRRVTNGAAAFTGARELARGLVTLPTHGLLAERDLSALERWLGEER